MENTLYSSENLIAGLPTITTAWDRIRNNKESIAPDNSLISMARNKIQIQQGLSLTEFLQYYGTEEQCRQTLFQWRWPKGFTCPACGLSAYCQLKCRILFQCKHCHTQTSLTAKTIFSATKLPIATWFLGIYLVTQSKTSVSALSLSGTLCVASNTVLLMKHKLQQIMKLRGDSKSLTALAGESFYSLK